MEHDPPTAPASRDAVAGQRLRLARALLFVPLGYAVVGPVAARIGVGTTLWVGAVWVIVSTAALLTVPGICTVRRQDAAEALRLAPAAG